MSIRREFQEIGNRNKSWKDDKPKQQEDYWYCQMKNVGINGLFL